MIVENHVRKKTFCKTLEYGHWLCIKLSAGLSWAAASGVQNVAAAVVRQAQAAAAARWRNTTPLALLLLKGRAGHLSLYLLCFSFTHTPLQAISFWMSANLLTLNTSKTEFLLIELNWNNNWLKLTSAHLTQYTLFVISASFLMNKFFLTRYLLFPNHVTHIFVNFAHPSISWSQNSHNSLFESPPSFTLSLTTTTHFTMRMCMTWLNMGI